MILHIDLMGGEFYSEPLRGPCEIVWNFVNVCGELKFKNYMSKGECNKWKGFGSSIFTNL